MDSIRKLTVDIDADSNKLLRALRVSQEAVRKFTTRVSESLGSSVGSDSLTAIATTAGAAGVAFVAATTAARKLGEGISFVSQTLRESELAFAKVATIADQATFPLERVQNISEQTARQFASSTAGQAEALYQAISAGATGAADAAEVLRQANALSIAGFADLSVTIDGLTTVPQRVQHQRSGFATSCRSILQDS